MPYNSNTLFQKMPDKVSFFYAQISKKWLELSLKKFSSYIFKNNGESETVLYLTNSRKRSFSRNSIFSLLFFEYESHFYMTLVNNSPHVASLLRVNISKLGCALQANFMLRYSPHVASLLRINISKFGCALQAYLTKSYRKRAHSSLRLGLLDSSPDPLHAELLLR